MLEALGALGGGMRKLLLAHGGVYRKFCGLKEGSFGGFGGGMPELNFGLRGGRDFWGNGGYVCRDISGLWGGYARTFGGFGVCRKSCGLRGGYAGTVVR